MNNQDIRWIQRANNFDKAFSQLKDAVELARRRQLSKLEALGFIQRFKYTHELGWNTLKDFLEEQGTQNLYGSRDTTRAAFRAGLIKNGEIWMGMIQSRNLTSHTYNGSTATQVVEDILEVYYAEFQGFQAKLQRLKNGETGFSAHPLRQSDCGLSESVIRKISDVFKRYPQVEKAVLYGSRANATHKTGSDIDLTLHGGQDLTLHVLLRIADDLDDLLLPYTFDLSIFRDIIDPDVTEHIRRVGVTMYEKPTP